MRILLVNYEYPPLGGGGGVLTRTLARALAADHDVVVLTSRPHGLPAEAFEDGARILRVPILARRDPNRATLASLASYPPAARARAARLLRTWTPGVVHSFFAIPSAPAGAWAARRAGAPHALTLIAGDLHDPTRRLSPDRFPPMGALVRRIVTRADAAVAISTDVARRAREITGREDIEVVPCAIDEVPLPARDRAALGWAEGEIVVVTVARLIRRKGLDTLVRAAARTGVRLEIVGDGPERDELERLARETGARAVFAGPLPAAERDRRLVSADLFALSSQHEGFGLAILEAMRAGLPVIATSAGGPADFVEEAASGHLVAPGDEAALADRIARLAADPAARRRMGEAARAAAARFSPTAMAARYLEVYERARGRRARSEAT
ncbi:MAG: glycosyltransferase family 4 protein [Acidobacteria bacterium]|nr:glycosyltransferase family 4 protein [Acidobacteriota bacterium]